ncbi:onanonoxo-7-onima-8-eninoihtemlysoneda [Schizopora paradoxa]|uniref:Onanonoxo-7-onima-8-eninoihtemlysoneda n=1 Tax=Schizopora paradoxa TaxID=27342 RepID=A0A0H2RH14_9AGAM|nr:onanonoxo-7-onima-8-eninoihtemlysoneda [Schizopora paradoxa]
MAHLYRNARIHQIFGANTDVGKTIITTALVRASASKQRTVQYLKPVSTGPLSDADDIFIKRYASDLQGNVLQTCLFRFRDPVSPHLAYNLERARNGDSSAARLKDGDLINAIRSHISEIACSSDQRMDLYLETAGGVHSPALTGTSQADFYRPLRLPTVLVGDSKLGGISTTISAYESLLMRGYTIDAVVLFKDDYYSNASYLLDYFGERSIFLTSLPLPPPMHSDPDENFTITKEYFADIQDEGYPEALVDHLDRTHMRRIEELHSMAGRASNKLWWPFVQHGLVKDEKGVTIIDSAYGDFFHTYNALPSETTPTPNLMENVFDGSASWWTQTFGHSHPSLALAAARAAGRYGHVMYPQAVHAPALNLAERLLEDGPGKGWACRAFYSDNGSTAMEVAIKMALRAYCKVHGKNMSVKEKEKLGVLGLRGSYHGDTIGVMDACEKASVYTCEWHSSRGFWLDAPSVAIRSGKTMVDVPESVSACFELAEDDFVFDSPATLYDVSGRSTSRLARCYEEYIKSCLRHLENQGSPRLAALVLEPLILGAGGMKFVDPLFQRVLVDIFRSTTVASPATGRWSGLPVIFDEVFVGLYRTGWESCAPILGVTPDIAVYAKMLTGGLLPLAVTLTSQHIFDSFLSESKADALLHGHSYTAHPVGCEVANTTLSMLREQASSTEWSEMKGAWCSPKTSNPRRQDTTMWSFWDPSFVNSLSHLQSIDNVMTLGTVLAIKFKGSAEGYQSHLAQSRLSSLSNNPDDELSDFAVHYRTLGDVAYFMSSLNTPLEVLRKLESKIISTLNNM